MAWTTFVVMMRMVVMIIMVVVVVEQLKDIKRRSRNKHSWGRQLGWEDDLMTAMTRSFDDSVDSDGNIGMQLFLLVMRVHSLPSVPPKFPSCG